MAYYSTGCISLYAFGKSEEEARAILDAQFEALVLRCVNPETTRSESSNATPNPDNLEKADDTPTSESEKVEPQKAEEKNQTFKLNPNRVTSRRDRTVKGSGQWEVRTTLYFGEIPLEVVSSEHMEEETARMALDYKVGMYIDRMTD